MELEINKDSAAVCEKICDEKAELSIEIEALIPDYMPKVFKIVKCTLEPVVLSKRAGASRLTVEGFVRAVMYYQESTQGQLCSLEQKQSFSKTFELEAADFESADIYTTGETEYVNCRAVNERRVDIRGAYLLFVRAYACMKKQIVTSMSGCGIQQKTVQLTSLITAQPYEKPVSLEDEFVFSKPPEAVISAVCMCTVNDCRITGGKAVCKGDAEVSVLYRTKGEAMLIKESKTLPFNEVAELASGAADKAFALAQPVSAAVTKDENGAYKASVSFLLDIYAQRTVQITAVADAYSTEYQTALEAETLGCETDEKPLHCSRETAISGKMPDTEAEIIGGIAEASSPEAVLIENEVKLRGKITVHVLCKNSLGEIDCYDKDAQYVLPQAYTAMPDALCVRAQAFVRSLSIRKAAGEMNAAVIVDVHGTVTALTHTAVLASAQCLERHEKADTALHICYAQQGEALFDIGKRYLASPAQIAAANGIAAEQLEQPARLIIPLSAQA